MGKGKAKCGVAHPATDGLKIPAKRGILLMSCRNTAARLDAGIAQSETLVDNGAPPKQEVP
jgi:hypothetical protein